MPLPVLRCLLAPLHTFNCICIHMLTVLCQCAATMRMLLALLLHLQTGQRARVCRQASAAQLRARQPPSASSK